MFVPVILQCKGTRLCYQTSIRFSDDSGFRARLEGDGLSELAKMGNFHGKKKGTKEFMKRAKEGQMTKTTF